MQKHDTSHDTEMDPEVRLEHEYHAEQDRWQRRTDAVVAKLRPSHRRAYRWLLRQLEIMSASGEMEHHMSSYTGMFLYDTEAHAKQIAAEFGSRFGSLRRFFNQLESLYGWEAFCCLGAWELPSLPRHLYARMMDELYGQQRNDGFPPF